MMKIFSPNLFIRYSKISIPFFALFAVILFIAGLYYAFWGSPADYLQGENVRIMYVHVPAAWMSLGVFLFIASCSLSSLVWRTRLSYILAISAAPIGAAFALITLITGSLWGKPTWGVFWVWDARLTSMFVLFLLYLSYIAVVNAGDNILRAERPAAVIALIGAINIPIIKFSVNLWHSLHQPASIIRSQGPSIDTTMLIPLMIMFAAYICYFFAILLIRTNNLINKLREDDSRYN